MKKIYPLASGPGWMALAIGRFEKTALEPANRTVSSIYNGNGGVDGDMPSVNGALGRKRRRLKIHGAGRRHLEADRGWAALPGSR